MKITIFTSSSNRHKYLVNSLINHNIYVIMEDKKKFSFLNSAFFKKTYEEKNYFKKVVASENRIFGKVYLRKKKIKKIYQIKYKKLNSINLKKLRPFLKSDLYIVFGSSYIKSNLIQYLIKKKCINIHIGVSPYYRGSNCNFWAIIDRNYDLVGATIHKLSRGLDDGPILYHSLVERIDNPIDYSMATVKSAILSLKQKIDDNSIFKLKSKKQNKKKQIRFSKNFEFNKSYLKRYPKKIGLKIPNKNLFINPVVLKKSYIYDKNIKTPIKKKFKDFNYC